MQQTSQEQWPPPPPAPYVLPPTDSDDKKAPKTNATAFLKSQTAAEIHSTETNGTADSTDLKYVLQPPEWTAGAPQSCLTDTIRQMYQECGSYYPTGITSCCSKGCVGEGSKRDTCHADQAPRICKWGACSTNYTQRLREAYMCSRPCPIPARPRETSRTIRATAENTRGRATRPSLRVFSSPCRPTRTPLLRSAR